MLVETQVQLPVNASRGEFMAYLEEFTTRIYERDSSATERSLRYVSDFFSPTEAELQQIDVIQGMIRFYTEPSLEDEFAQYVEGILREEEIQETNFQRMFFRIDLVSALLESS